MCDSLKSLRMSLLNAHITQNPFKTNIINGQTCGLKIQQHIQQIIHFLKYLITKFERPVFCINVKQNANVLRGAYPTSV